MKSLYHNLYIHFVFTTAKRLPLIQEKHRNRIEKYITGILRNHGCRLYSIYINPDHLHILLSKSPEYSENELSTIIADSSALFINDNNMVKGVFAWQQTCSAFSVSKNNVEKVCIYILNQPEHHKKHTFEQEYQDYLKIYQQTIKPAKLNDPHQ